MAILELNNIRKSYYLGQEEFPVLKGIDISFDQGDFISILGESGGGKSTLMNIIGGLDREYQGDVILKGQRQKDRQEKAMDAYRRETVGFIFQSFNLINYLSVLENVMTSLHMTDLSPKDQVQQAETLLQQVGLFDHRFKKPNQLSGGQKQRVAIARALASDPEIIIADEPTGALDSQNTQDVLKILQDIASSGKTVIVVTHSQEVANSGTRIVRLADGQVIGDERLRPAFSQTGEDQTFGSQALKASSVWKMAWSHFINAWKQNMMITIGTAIGLFSVIFFLGLGNGATNYMNSFIEGVANPKAFQVSRKDASPLTSEEKNHLSKLDHVTAVEEGYLAQAFTLTYKGKVSQGRGLATVNDTIVADAVSSKAYPKNDEIVVSQEFATQAVGEDTDKIVGEKVTLTIRYGDQKIEKVYRVSGVYAAMNLVTYQSLEEAAKASGQELKANFVTLTIDDINNTSHAQDQVADIKEANQEIYTVTSISDLLDSIVEVTSIVTIVLAIVAGISLLVSILMIVATTYMSVSERTKEIGVLRAMGARKKDIRRLFIDESLLLGISASILAILVAFLVQQMVNAAVQDIVKFEIIQISIAHITISVVIGLIIALLASIFPAGKAARLNTIEALAAE